MTEERHPLPGRLTRHDLGYRVAVVAIVLLAFGVRVYHLGAMGLEYDEAFSIQAAYSGFAYIIHIVSTNEPHPPFYYSFLRVWFLIAGPREFALRFPTLFANVVTIVVLARLADRLSWRWAGVVAGLILALNPYQVWYAQEARMYTPVAMFGVLAVYFATRALQTGRQRDLVAYGAFAVLALFTHYYAMFLEVFVNVAIFAAIFSQKQTRLTLQRWVVTQVIIGVLFVPWLAFAYRVSLYYIRALPGAVNLPDVIKESLIYYSVGTSVPEKQGLLLSFGFLMVLVAGMWWVGKAKSAEPRWYRLLFAVGYLLMPMTVGLIVSFFRSMFDVRYFMVSAPAFFLVLGLGVVGLFRLFRPLGVLALLYVLGAQLFSLNNYYFNPLYDKAEFAKAETFIEKHLQPGDAITLDGWEQATQFWYYHTLLFHDPSPSYMLPAKGDGSQEWPRTYAEIRDVMATHRGTWLLDYGVADVDGKHLVETYLARHYYQAFYHPIIRNRVVYYAAPPHTAPTVTAVNATCNGTLLLRDIQTYATSVKPGEIVPFTLDWQAIAAPRQQYVVSWRLLDAAGHTVLQRDSEPADGFAPTETWKAGEDVADRFGMVVPTDLPPGTYSLGVVVYAKTTGVACQFTRGGVVVPDPVLSLTTLQVQDAPPVPSLISPTPTHPATFQYGGLALTGFDLQSGPYRPGDVVSARLYWHVGATTADNLSIDGHLVDPNGTSLQDTSRLLGPSSFPTSKWQLGRTIATYLDVPIPARTDSGTYHLTFTLNGEGLAPKTYALGAVPIVSRSRSFVVPPIPNHLNANFGGSISLLGYDLQPTPSEVMAGQTLQLTLYWQAQQEMATSYKVFTHLVGPNGKIYGQDDSIPMGGTAPTDSWVPGEVLTDHYSLTIHPNAPPGDYQLVVGFYNPDTGARLPVQGQDSSSVLVARVHLAA